MQSAELKFNCFFLMPLLDAFPQRLREELEGAWEVRGADGGGSGWSCEAAAGCRRRGGAVGGRLAAKEWAASAICR